MSAPSAPSAPPSAPRGSGGPLLPPPEQFWERYSPHYEFPLSTVGSAFLHVFGFAAIFGLLWLMFNARISDKVPVPMRQVTIDVDDPGTGDGAAGSGGGTPMEDVNPTERPMDPVRNIPDAVVKEVLADVKDWVPTIPQADDAPRVEDLPNVKKLADLNADLRKKLLQGDGGEKGKGNEPGRGSTGQEGPNKGGNGDATSSKSRAIRWNLIFRTEHGRDYVSQLAAMKASLVIEQPPDFKFAKLYRNIGEARPTGENFDTKQLPGLFFIDDSPDSAARVAKAMGLDFSPPRIMAFFPKDVEEELAAKERSYRNRKEHEILETTFRIIIREGKYIISVSDQTPVRR